MNWFMVPAAVAVAVLFLIWDAHHYTRLHDRIEATEARVDALLEHLRLDITEPVTDDSPGTEAALYEEPETDEFPALPPTEPSGIPLAVHTALIDSRPLPHKRDQVEMVERTVNIGGHVQTFRIRANRVGE